MIRCSSDDERRHLKKKNYNAESAAMKHELSEELKRPLMVRGVSARYPTSGLAGQAGFADSMLAKTSEWPQLAAMRRPADASV